MKKIKYLILLFTIFYFTASYSQDKLTEILKSELKYEMEQLSKQDLPPYYINFRVVDNEMYNINASFGAIQQSTNNHVRYFMPHIRVGNEMFDNFYYSSQAPRSQSSSEISLTDDNDKTIRMVIWAQVEDVYLQAKNIYSQSKAKFDIDTKQEDKAPNFVETESVNYYEEAITDPKYKFDTEKWQEKARKYSALFNSNKHIISSSVNISFVKDRKYFVDTDNTSVVQNETYAQLSVMAATKADDGMELPLYKSYFAFSPSELPSDEVIEKDIQDLIAKLEELRVAPLVTPYAGPALMAGNAAGVFFHEIFGHRIEGQRMKTSQDGQTFKSMVGKQLLPEGMFVFDDPSMKEYKGKPLYGYYKYDDQGVKGKHVDVIKNGVLNEFLMSRTGIDGFPASNGHGRAAIGFNPTARQSNLVVETKNHKTDAELRALLISEMKKQNKEYGYFFKQVSAGLAFTGANQVNSFNVTPLEVYRVSADGSADVLVRGVDMIGTPLSIFENIKYAGGDTEIFTGTCGAESGGIPVTAIAPTVLLTKVEVQNKPKPTNQLPILTRPGL